MTTLILFDVDGTLTESRLKIKQNMIDTIDKLKQLENLDIGIVGGSNLPKQEEQLGIEILDKFKWKFSENGLVAYHHNELINKTSIADFLGEDKIKKVINTILGHLATVDIPKKRGTFIEFRNGMINCCPVGRSCSYQERIEFFNYDNQHNIRKNIVSFLEQELADLNLSFSIGGQISIDIFPKGWDKTYCLQFVKEKYNRILFFGDRTDKGGNDYEIYSSELTESYQVKSPEDTIEILEKLFFK